MKNIILITIYFFTLNVNAQNFIFENEKENNLISFYENTKIEFLNDKIKYSIDNKEYIFEFKDEFNNSSYLKNPKSININYYIDTFKIEDLQCLTYVEYGDVKVYLKEKLYFENNGKSKIYLNSKEYQNPNNSKNEPILLNNQDKIQNNEELNFEIAYSSFVGNGNSISGSSSKDEDDNFYFTGFSSTNLDAWIQYAYQSNISGSQDFFVVKIDKNENIIWGTYVGSPGKDGSCYIDTKQGMVWVAGESHSNGFPCTNKAIQTTHSGEGDITIFRLDYEGKFEFGTYHGGSRYDTAIDVKIDDDGIAWITGRFYSADNFYSTNNAEFPNHLGDDDGFLMGFNNDNDLIYSSRIGGSNNELVETMCITKNYLILGGYSNSTNLRNLISMGNSTSFLTAINRKTLTTDWSLRFQGSGIDAVQSLHSVSNDSDEFYVAGYTENTQLGFGDAYQSEKNGGIDYYLRKFKEDGTLLKSTYLGGSSNEGNTNVTSFQGGGISHDSEGNIYVSGQTNSEDFPVTENALQKNKNLLFDTFVSVFDSELEKLLYSTFIGGSNDETGRDILFYNNDLYVNGWTRSSNFRLTENAVQKSSKGPYTGYILKISQIISLPDTCSNHKIEYTNFHSKQGLNLVANAVTYDSTLRLTKPDVYQKGAVWLSNPVSVVEGFHSKFTFEFSEGKDNGNYDGSTEGADGIAFVIQGDTPDVIGYAGGGIGIENLRNAFAIELDMFMNDEFGFNDPNGNHIAAFSSKGLLKNDHNSDNFISQNNYLDEIKIDKTRYEMNIIYDEENKYLYVYLNEVNARQELVLEVSDFDIRNYLDLFSNEGAYIGITGATGHSVQRQELFSFEFCGGDFISSVERNSDNTLLYPSPASDYIFIYNQYLAREVKVIDVLGNIYFPENNGNMIDVSSLKSGFYILEIKTGENIVYQKFIKE